MKNMLKLVIMSLALLIVIMGSFSTADASVPVKKSAIKSVECINHSYVRIKWTKVKDAEKYQIYRATSKNGGYKWLKNSQNTYYCDCSINDSKTYSYKVR